MALKSGSLNLKGIFDTCNLFAWLLFCSDSTANVRLFGGGGTDVDVPLVVASAAASGSVC